MKITPTLKAFIEEMAYRSEQASDAVAVEDAISEFTSQIAEDDCAFLVRFAIDSGVKLPRQLTKYREQAMNLFDD